MGGRPKVWHLLVAVLPKKRCTLIWSQQQTNNHLAKWNNTVAPPGMYKSLQIMGWTTYQLVQDFFHQQYFEKHFPEMAEDFPFLFPTFLRFLVVWSRYWPDKIQIAPFFWLKANFLPLSRSLVARAGLSANQGCIRKWSVKSAETRKQKPPKPNILQYRKDPWDWYIYLTWMVDFYGKCRKENILHTWILWENSCFFLTGLVFHLRSQMLPCRLLLWVFLRY